MSATDQLHYQQLLVRSRHQYDPKHWTKHAEKIQSEFNRDRDKLGFPDASRFFDADFFDIHPDVSEDV